jgi:hypothetical protein
MQEKSSLETDEKMLKFLMQMKKHYKNLLHENQQTVGYGTFHIKAQ